MEGKKGVWELWRRGGGTRQGIIAEGPPRLKRGPKLQAMDVVRNQGGTSGKRVRAGANLQPLRGVCCGVRCCRAWVWAIGVVYAGMLVGGRQEPVFTGLKKR